LPLGCHVSIKGGLNRAVERAVQLGCDTFQVFTRSPRMWKARPLPPSEVEAFKAGVKRHQLAPVFSHMPYLPNLATTEEPIYSKSVEALTEELRRSRSLGIPYVVVHLGSHKGKGLQTGHTQVVKALEKATEAVPKHPKILLENTSGKPNDVGSTLQELAQIADATPLQLGFCLDTCHAYARGYDLASPQGLRDTLEALESHLGWENLELVHLNDSLGELGSRLDRHTHIGLGRIGLEGFKNLLLSPLGEKPLILETPVDEVRGDRWNLEVVRGLLRDRE